MKPGRMKAVTAGLAMIAVGLVAAVLVISYHRTDASRPQSTPPPPFASAFVNLAQRRMLHTGATPPGLAREAGK
jgi:hypothetical protein